MRGGRSVSEYFLSSPCGFSSDRTLWKILLPEAHAPVGHLIHHHRNHLPHQTLQTPPRHRPLQTPPQIHLNTPNRIPLPPDILPRNPLLRSPPDHRPHLCHPRNRNPHPQMTAYPLHQKNLPHGTHHPDPLPGLPWRHLFYLRNLPGLSEYAFRPYSCINFSSKKTPL